jgi:hypothetical protein
MLACAFAVHCFVACRPELPEHGMRRADEPSDSHSLRVEPDLPLDALPQAFRLRIVPPGGAELGLGDVYLVTGSLGAPSLRALERGDPSSALEARLVELSAWREGEELVVAPTTWLAPGERYTLALPTLGASLRLDVAEAAPPRLERVFPPEASSSLLVYCGELELPVLELALELAPGSVPARLFRGTPGGRARRCASLELLGPAELVLPPPALEVDGAVWSLDPRPIELDGAGASEAVALGCEPGELRFGPGCAYVEDDRLRLRAPERALFWAVSGGSLDAHFVTRAGGTTTLRGLEPGRRQTVEVEWLDANGRWSSERVALETDAPRAHFVLSEVYADAIGPEPQQEWVEIVNDGLAPGSLEGHLLFDVGGSTALPEAWLAPGEHALVVEEGYDASGAWDAPPAPGTQLVRVPKLGKSGLSNQGEPLRLDDPEGRVLSRFPATPKPKPGVSIARRLASADDGDPASFARAERGPTPGSSNEGSFAD